MNILVVDDDDSIRELLAMALQGEGHDVTTAADGLEALDALRRGPLPSLVLLDMMLPRLDGEGVLHELHADERLARIPVVMVSGHQAAREKAAELGVHGVLVKPIELDDLLATVAELDERSATPA